MSKTIVKWGLLVAGSTVSALSFGTCFANWILQTTVLSWVN